MLIENNKKTSKGRKGGNYKTSGWLNYYNLAIQLKEAQDFFTRAFIAVRLLSEGKPRINPVPLN